MADRPRFFDDLAGMAGGAMSALTGPKDEAEATMRARAEEMIRKFDLVRRDDLDAIAEMAANARAGQEEATLRLVTLEARLAKLEAQMETMATAAMPVPTPASSVLPDTMPGQGPNHPPHGGDTSASAVTPAAMPDDTDAPGSMPPLGTVS